MKHDLLKRQTQRTRVTAAVAAACLLWSLAGCGQRGPLYLPDENPDGSPSSRTAPAQEENPEEENDGATTGT